MTNMKVDFEIGAVQVSKFPYVNLLKFISHGLVFKCVHLKELSYAMNQMLFTQGFFSPI